MTVLANRTHGGGARERRNGLTRRVDVENSAHTGTELAIRRFMLRTSEAPAHSGRGLLFETLTNNRKEPPTWQLNSAPFTDAANLYDLQEKRRPSHRVQRRTVTPYIRLWPE